MKRFYLLFFILGLPLFLKAQCVPDATFSNQPIGLYPSALSDQQIAQGLVTAEACKGANLNVVFTLVFDKQVFGATIDSIRMSNVVGLPPGITWQAPSLSISQKGLACFVLTGTPRANAQARDYQITFKALAWLNGGATPSNVDFPGTLVQGKYIIRVREAVDCCKLSLETTNTPAVCLTTNNGQAGVTVNNATGAIKYQWDAATGNQTTQIATGLKAGTYAVTVSDAIGCTATASVTVGVRIGSVDFGIRLDNEAGCARRGKATIINTTGRAPFTYAWSNGTTTISADNLAPGNYTATVTDNTGCNNIKSITIPGDPNAINFTVNTQNTSCSDRNDGSAEVSIVGGTAGATFAWSTGATTARITGLAPGSYTVTVTKDGCSAEEMVTVQAAALASVTINSDGSSCTGGLPTAITAVGTGGNGGFTYSWSNGVNLARINTPAAGSYTVTATDSRGCQATRSITLSGERRDPITLTARSNQVSCNATEDGSAMVTAVGGDGNYNYLWSNGRTTASITNIAPGSYTVTVSDNSGCTTTQAVTVGKVQTFTLSADLNSVNCGTLANGRITLTPNRGAITDYTFNWSNGATTASINSLRAGNYNVTVTEMSTGCIVTNQYTIVESNPLTISNLSVNDVLCNGDATGRATITVAGGSGTFTYAWSNGATTAQVTNLRAGSYTVTATDQNGCSIERGITVGQPERIVPNASAMNEMIANDGSATADPTGGRQPYTFLWSKEGNSNFSRTTRTINNLSPGQYTLRVLDANSCSMTQTVVVAPSNCTAINISANTVAPTCNGVIGSISVTVEGGNSPYTYAWSNGKTTATIDSLQPGEYCVTVTDRDGCPSNRCFTVNDLSKFEVRVTDIRPVTCVGGRNGSITVAAGVGSFTYRWSNGINERTINNLSAGNYTVTVTNSAGCQVTETVRLNAPDSIVARITSKMDASCVGLLNGMTSVGVVGGKAPFTYRWSTGATQDTIRQIGAGMYQVTITDADNCTASTSVTIAQPDSLLATLQIEDTACPGVSSGIANVTARGGTSPYRYAWSNGSGNVREIINLGKGNYDVTITDNNNCTITLPFSIKEPDSLFITFVGVSGETSVGASNGRATVVATGGTAPYQYRWDNGATTASVSNLAGGMRSVTVIDSRGCAKVGTIRINEAACTISASVSGTNVSCNGGNNGTATVQVSNSSTQLTYRWSNGARTQNIDGLTAGSYAVTVSEANGCEAVGSVFIAQPVILVASIITKTDVNCDGTLGTATATAAGGTGNITYRWSNGANTPSTANLAAGNYTVTATDQNGCTAITNTTIRPANTLGITQSVNNVTCAGESNGSITINVAGATGTLSYRWQNNISTTNSANQLAAGNYQVTVTDQGGCESAISVRVNEPSALQIAINSTNETSAGGNNGTAMPMVVGGTAPYRYNWSNGATTANVNNLAPGTYTVTVTDQNNCTAMRSVTIEPSNQSCAGFDIELVAKDATCANENNGSVQVGNVGSNGPLRYLWSTGDTIRAVNNLLPGKYKITVTDGVGCTSIDSVMVNSPSPIQVQATISNVDCNDFDNGSISLQANGGQAPYIFAWSIDNNGGNQRQQLSAGNYLVTITDASRCNVVETFTIGVAPDRIPPTVRVKPATIYLDNFGTADLTVDMIDNGSNDNCAIALRSLSRTKFNCQDLGAVNVMFKVTDKNGNVDSMMATVNVLDTIKPFINCLNQDIVIRDCKADRTITFLTPEAFDNCGDALTPTLVTGLPSGSIFPPGLTEQMFMVRDAAGNEARCAFNVDFRVLEVNLVANEPSCHNFADGSITANVINSSGTIFYDWNNGRKTKTNTGLTAGNYTLTVVDAQGCTRIETIRLNQPEPLEVNIETIINPSPDQNNGAIKAKVLGGKAPYKVQWVKIEATQTLVVGNELEIINLVPGMYRLSVEDASGCFSTSDLVSLEVSSTNRFDVDYHVALNPNPTSGLVFLELQQDQSRPYTVTLFDLTGRRLEVLVHSDYRSAQTFDLSKYQNGIYFLRIQIADQILTKRLVILKE